MYAPVPAVAGALCLLLHTVPTTTATPIKLGLVDHHDDDNVPLPFAARAAVLNITNITNTTNDDTTMPAPLLPPFLDPALLPPELELSSETPIFAALPGGEAAVSFAQAAARGHNPLGRSWEELRQAEAAVVMVGLERCEEVKEERRVMVLAKRWEDEGERGEVWVGEAEDRDEELVEEEEEGEGMSDWEVKEGREDGEQGDGEVTVDVEGEGLPEVDSQKGEVELVDEEDMENWWCF